MSKYFERQLEELHVQLITLGSYCEKAISLASDENDIYFGIAVIYINSMRFEKAAQIFEKIIKSSLHTT